VSDLETHKVDTSHDFGGSAHETHQFSICQRGSEALHDPQLVAHAGNNMRLTFLLPVSASVACIIGCHCGVCIRWQMDNSVSFDWILSCVNQPSDACCVSAMCDICSVQHIGGAAEGFFCLHQEANAGHLAQNATHQTR